MMARILPAATALALIIMCGVVHGVWTDRWGNSTEPGASAARLAEVPKIIGDWEAVQEFPIAAGDLAMGEITGYINRGYLNRRTRKGLAVLCVCGKPGPIGQHPPTVCFGGAGFEEVKHRHMSLETDGSTVPAQFFLGEFRNNTSVIPEWERVYWSWSGNGTWTAPQSTRLAFSHLRALYKLYVIHKMSGPDESAEEDPAPEFLKLFIPELQRVLFTPR